MALQCFVLLLIFLSKCLGHTEFMYTAKDEVKLLCDTNTWEISTESDNRIDCRVECVHGDPLILNKSQESCTNKDSFKFDEKCQLIARRGFFGCVTALDSGFLYPFKPFPDTVTSYIVATLNEGMTTKPEERSSVELTEGEDVLLNCSFIFTEGQDSMTFIVYWIKTIGKNSNCVYSYDFDLYGVRYNHHCNVKEELLYRLSNQTEDKTTHNIRISNVTESGGGQYLCALQERTKVKWKIINNITVSVRKAKGSEKAENRFDLSFLYAIIPILLVLITIAIMGCLWKKSKISSGSQVTNRQKNQKGYDLEETADMECSPYAVGNGEEFGLKQEGLEESTDIYSVVKQNDLYEPGP